MYPCRSDENDDWKMKHALKTYRVSQQVNTELCLIDSRKSQSLHADTPTTFGVKNSFVKKKIKV